MPTILAWILLAPLGVVIFALIVWDFRAMAKPTGPIDEGCLHHEG